METRQMKKKGRIKREREMDGWKEGRKERKKERGRKVASGQVTASFQTNQSVATATASFPKE